MKRSEALKIVKGSFRASLDQGVLFDYCQGEISYGVFLKYISELSLSISEGQLGMLPPGYLNPAGNQIFMWEEE